MTALALAIGIADAGSALAQNAPAPSADAPAKTADKDLEIIVTGSRISKAGFTAPSPTTVIGADTLQARVAVNVASVLYEVPAIQPRPSPSGTSQLGGNFVSIRSVGGGAAGASRTLVLVDGNRFVPTNNQGQIDLNVIPTVLVDRIDIVTAGASAAYGSDAITGVVNIILKKKLEGFVGSIQSGISEQGDGAQYNATLAWGTSFDNDRGQFMIAGEYSKAPDTITQGDRAWSRNQTGLVPNSSIPNQVTGLIRADGVTLTGFTNGGGIVGANLATAGRQFVSNGAGGVIVAALNNGVNVGNPFGTGTTSNNLTTSAPANTQIGGDGGSLSNSLLLVAPNERKTLFARASYEFSPALRLWADGSYAKSEAHVDYQGNFIRTNEAGGNGIRESALIDNYTAAGVLSGQVANPLLAGLNLGAGTFAIRRLTPELGAVHTDTAVRVLRGAFGAEGQIAASWRWNAYFEHGETRFVTDLRNNIIQPNLAAALDVVVFNGALTCRANVPGAVIAGARADGSTPQTGRSPGCVVANPIGPGSLASARDYITGTLRNIVDYTQDAGGAEIQGDLFSIGGAQPVSIVVGADWRRDKVVQAVSGLNNAGATINDFSNLVNLTYSTGSFQQANPKSFTGSNTVKEGFGEIAIPVFADGALGRSLDLNGAVRYTDYSNGGTVTTWKAGGTYSPVQGLLFRFTQSRDIRVGTLTQLYGNSAGAAIASPAPGANVPAAANNVSYATNNTAGTGLVPEKSDTTTFGFSTSNLLPGLSLSVDFYRLSLKGGIANIGTPFVLNSCYGTGGTTLDTALCNAYVSDGLGNVGTAAIVSQNTTHTLLNPQLNIQNVVTKGVDFEMSQRLSLANLGIKSNGVLTTRMLASYVDSLVFSQAGTVTVDRAGDVIGGVPHWRWTLTETYQNGPFTLNLQGRLVGSFRFDNLATVIDPASATGAFYTNPATLPVGNRIPAVFYLNVGASFRIVDWPGQRIEMFGNINNLLDKDPPFTASSSVSNAAAGSATYTNNAFYDVLGRAYTVGVRFKF